MPENEWSEPMQTAWQEFEAQVREAGQRLQSHLPPMLKAEVITLEAVEMITQKITQVLGQTMVQSWAQEIVQTAEPSNPPSCAECATAMRKIGLRPLTKLGCFGPYTWARAYYCCDQGHSGVAPMDARLQIGPERYTPTLAQAVTAFAVNVPFDQIPPRVNTLIPLRLDGDTIRRVIERVGQVAENGE